MLIPELETEVKTIIQTHLNHRRNCHSPTHSNKLQKKLSGIYINNFYSNNYIYIIK